MEQLTNIGELIFSLVIVGFLTESVVEILKLYFFRSAKSERILFFLSVIVGMILVFALQVSLFDKENVFAFYVGMAICGLVASRGSNYAHNWLDKIPKK